VPQAQLAHSLACLDPFCGSRPALRSRGRTGSNRPPRRASAPFLSSEGIRATSSALPKSSQMPPRRRVLEAGEAVNPA